MATALWPGVSSAAAGLSTRIYFAAGVSIFGDSEVLHGISVSSTHDHASGREIERVGLTAPLIEVTALMYSYARAHGPLPIVRAVLLGINIASSALCCQCAVLMTPWGTSMMHTAS